MGIRRLFPVLVLLLPLFVAQPAEACATSLGVPCGRIYPIILIQVENQPNLYNLTADSPVEVEATLTYKFDVVNEGYTVATPQEPVKITFEFPRKPAWADMKVEPETLNVDVNNPTYIQPDTTEPTNPQGQFVWTAKIKITASLVGQAVLKDGFDYAKLLVFAKSTESGLYQSGYGIKELRVAPEGALHEADVAGSRDVYTAVPLPNATLQGTTTSFGGTTITLTPPEKLTFWQPAQFGVTLDPAPPGEMLLAMHDEAGDLVALSSPMDAAMGEGTLNATLVKPGLHTLSVTLLPAAGSMTPPATFALDFQAGDTSAAGFVFPKSMLVTTSHVIPAPSLGGDPRTQFVRDVPFFVFDTAQSVSATVSLKTTLAELGRGVANLEMMLVDPEGKVLQTASVDAVSFPTKGIRVGSVPSEGWYALRVRGVGLPSAAAFDARIEVAYANAPQARNHADNAPDVTPDILGMGGVNLTLPRDGLAVWAPGDLTPSVEGASAYMRSVTVLDANGTLAYASGLREGAMSFSAPAPGLYRAFAYATPMTTGTPFAPIVRAFTFGVGQNGTTIAQTYAIEDAPEVPPGSASDTLLALYALPTLPGAGEPNMEATGATATLADADTPGAPRYVTLTGSNPTPQVKAASVAITTAFAEPQTLVGPEALAPANAGGLPIPALAVGTLLAAIGALAVIVALVRRK